MKKFKKMMALVVAMVMVLSMSIAVFAEGETYKITITANADNDTHTYEAYQIMTGDLDTDENSATKGQLKNLAWGTGVDGATLLNALKSDATIGSKFTDCDATAPSVAAAMGECTVTENVEALAAVIGAYVKSAGLSAAGTSSGNVINGLAQGYYFVKDVTADNALTYDTKSQFMLQVVGDVTVTAKDSTVSVEKKVDDKNDSTTGEDAIAWQDTADYDVNDVIPYMLKGTLPSNYAKFDFFDYTFTDEMCTGLTLNANSVKVVYYADEAALAADTTATGGTDITNQFTITPTANAAGATLTVSKVSSWSGEGEEKTLVSAGLKDITALTADSVIVVYYTATLNENAVIGATGNENTVKLTFSNNPNATGDGDNTTTETPEDTNIVFTYQVDVNKFDEKNEPLAGATFALYKEVSDAITAGAKTGAAIKAELGDDVKAAALGDAKSYVVVGTIEATKASGATNYTASFQRVDDGNYVLVETVVPSGYNAWDAKAFTINATHTQDPAELKLSDLTATGTGIALTGNTAKGSLSTDVVNNSGAVLPSTGGIGTTIFYIVGAILVVGAGILLVTRRRMSAN